MKHRIEVRPEAWADLQQIADWYLIAFDPETAQKVTDAILKAIGRLADFTLSGSFLPDEQLKSQGYRLVISGRHIAIYRFIDGTVYVYHIADTRTEYKRLFHAD